MEVTTEREILFHFAREVIEMRGEKEETLDALLHCSVEEEEEEKQKEFQMASLLHVSESATSAGRKYLELM